MTNNGTNLLWYRQGAQSWNEALPLGNGRVGAMVYGGAREEKLALNEDTLWSGIPAYYENPTALEAYTKARQLAREGRYEEAEKELEQRFTNLWSQVYLALGELTFTFYGLGEVTNYRRELDLASAVHRVEYEADGVCYQRETFISNPDQVLVMHTAFASASGECGDPQGRNLLHGQCASI